MTGSSGSRGVGGERRYVVVVDGQLVAEPVGYDAMREAAYDVGHKRWADAGAPLDPAWPRAAAEAHLWGDLPNGGWEFQLPDGTDVKIENVTGIERVSS